jgi:predicted DNA-binding transcriptional regulator YafY
MGKNKNAAERYRILDECFANHSKRFYIEDLVNEVNEKMELIHGKSKGISSRQIYTDIKDIDRLYQSAEILRLSDGKRKYFRYKDPKFSIRKMPLNHTEIAAIRMALGLIKGIVGMNYVLEIEPILDRINLEYSNADETHHEMLIGFDSNPNLRGIKNLETIFNAIVLKQVLKISYQPFNKEPVSWLVHPHYLKEYNNRWFLFGRNESLNKEIWNLAIDRIIDIENHLHLKYIPSKINWVSYFEDMLGVTRPENSEITKIILHVSGEARNYIETKPLHHSQRTRQINDQTMELTMFLILNKELELQLLPYIDSIKIIQPEDLKSNLYRRLKSAIQNQGINAI